MANQESCNMASVCLFVLGVYYPQVCFSVHSFHASGCLCLQEGPFVYMSLVGTVETSEGPLAELCEFNF